jgi:hypothetical protein
METFNGNVSKWNIENNSENSNLTYFDRINKYKEIKSKIENNDDLCQIEAIERIGSDSSMG